MGLYNDLTQEQKETLAQQDLYMRGLLNGFSKFYSGSNATLANTFFATQVAPILALLDSTETIPNASNLAGSLPLLVSDYTTLITAIQSIEITYNTNIATIGRAIGLGNA